MKSNWSDKIYNFSFEREEKCVVLIKKKIVKFCFHHDILFFPIFLNDDFRLDKSNIVFMDTNWV